MRVLADIPDDDLARLDALALREGRSRAAALRDAVRLYLARMGDDRGWIAEGAGLWQGRDDLRLPPGTGPATQSRPVGQAQG